MLSLDHGAVAQLYAGHMSAALNASVLAMLDEPHPDPPQSAIRAARGIQAPATPFRPAAATGDGCNRILRHQECTLLGICAQRRFSQDTIQPEAKDVARLLCGECLFFAPLAEAARYKILPSAAFTLAIASWPGRDTRLGL